MTTVKTPERKSAAAFSRYAAGAPLQDSAALGWEGPYVRRYRFPCVVDRFLVPATPEPLISCGIAGSAEFQEREVDGEWVTRKIGKGHIFVTRSKTAAAQPLGTNPEATPVEIECLHSRASRVAEYVKLPAQGILLQPAANQSVEPVKPLRRSVAPTARYTLRVPAPRLSIEPPPSQCWPARELPAHQILLRLPATPRLKCSPS